MRRCIATLAVAVGVIAALPAAAQANYHLAWAKLSPSCVSPGDKVTASAGVRQDSNDHQPLYLRVSGNKGSAAGAAFRWDSGPYYFPQGNWQVSRSFTVPRHVPYGEYKVNEQAGSHRGGSEWGAWATGLSVRPKGKC